jgi:hypothetical protein
MPKLRDVVHLTVNGGTMCNAHMEIRHFARGCSMTKAQSVVELAKLRERFPDDTFEAVPGECPVYAAEYLGVTP